MLPWCKIFYYHISWGFMSQYIACHDVYLTLACHYLHAPSSAPDARTDALLLITVPVASAGNPKCVQTLLLALCLPTSCVYMKFSSNILRFLSHVHWKEIPQLIKCACNMKQSLYCMYRALTMSWYSYIITYRYMMAALLRNKFLFETSEKIQMQETLIELTIWKRAWIVSMSKLCGKSYCK